MHSLFTIKPRLTARIAVAALVCAAACAFGQSQQESELDQGLRYVQGLQRLYFLDIADAVLKELSARFPEAATRAAALQLEGDLARGKFDEVKARIAAAEKNREKEDVVWAMKLALADSYFTYAKFDECRAIYGGFFKAFQKEDPKTKKTTYDIPASLETVFTDAAYKYAQMLLNMKKREEAIGIYRVLLSAGKLPQHVARQCMAEMAEVGLSLADEAKDAKVRDEYLKEVNATCDKLLWVQDLWFGKAIVLKAHGLMLQDKPEDAKLLVDRYMGTLTTIHQALVEQEKETGDPLTRVSPMAECRYLLAVMLQEKAQEMMAADGFSVNDPKQREAVLSLLLGSKDTTGKRKGDGAYNHFVNVYLKYPESNWAADAGEKSEAVREILVNDFGGKVNAAVTPEQTARVRTIQYRDARALYAQGQIAAAKERLGQVLNSFPDCEESVTALGDLARCYIQGIQEDEDAILYAQTVIGHLAERFCERRNSMNAAGDELIRIAEYWGEYGRPDIRLDTYAQFFKFYPSHPSCVSYLTSFGEKAYQEKDYPHALEFYTIVANSYTNSPRAFDALSRMASIYEEGEDYAHLIPVLNDLIARLKTQPKPTQMLFSSRFRKANALRGMALGVIKSDTTNATEIAGATRSLSLAVKEFDDLAADLASPPPSAEVDEKEKKLNATIREVSLFNKALSLTQIPGSDPARLDKMRDLAIATYEELIKAYPQGSSAPTALIQIGSIYAMKKDAEKAEAALSRLRKDYPDSEQAKSALPLIADNLMKLGMREEAVSRYREMFSAAGANYSDHDMLRASTALMEAKEFELARIGLDKILGRAGENAPIRAQARFAECRLLVAQKDYDGAVAKLQAFIKDYPNLSIVIDAYLLLSQASSEAGLVEKNGDHRFDLFNVSIDAMKEVKKRRTNDVESASCDIETGRIMARKAKAEAEFGDARKAAEYRGKALISYQVFIDSVVPGATRLLPLVEVAYYESVPLLIDHGQWEVVTDNCNEYLQRFPQGKYASQFNAWKNQAKIELGDKGGAAPAPAAKPAAEEPEADDGE